MLVNRMIGLSPKTAVRAKTVTVPRVSLRPPPPQSRPAFVSSRFLSVVLRAAACVPHTQLKNTRLNSEDRPQFQVPHPDAFLKSELSVSER